MSAALEWAKQGHQKRLDRDQSTGQFTIPANIAGMDAPVSMFLIQTDLGFGSRPTFTLAPVEGLGAHLRMDIVTLLDQMGSLAREFPMRPGGIGLVWTVPWDGARVEELLLERLHPFYIEVCRRIRLRPGPEGNLAAVRTSSKAARFRLIYGYFSECSGAADSGDFGNWRGRFYRRGLYIRFIQALDCGFSSRVGVWRIVLMRVGGTCLLGDNAEFC